MSCYKKKHIKQSEILFLHKFCMLGEVVRRREGYKSFEHRCIWVVWVRRNKRKIFKIFDGSHATVNQLSDCEKWTKFYTAHTDFPSYPFTRVRLVRVDSPMLPQLPLPPWPPSLRYPLSPVLRPPPSSLRQLPWTLPSSGWPISTTLARPSQRSLGQQDYWRDPHPTTHPMPLLFHKPYFHSSRRREGCFM